MQKSEVFPIKASSSWWAQITASPWGLTQQWSERREECVLQVWTVPCVSVKRFSTASNDTLLTGSWDVWGHFGLEIFHSFLYFQPSWWGARESSHIDRKLECQDLYKLKHVYSWFVLTHQTDLRQPTEHSWTSLENVCEIKNVIFWFYINHVWLSRMKIKIWNTLKCL